MCVPFQPFYPPQRNQQDIRCGSTSIRMSSTVNPTDSSTGTAVALRHCRFNQTRNPTTRTPANTSLHLQVFWDAVQRTGHCLAPRTNVCACAICMSHKAIPTHMHSGACWAHAALPPQFALRASRLEPTLQSMAGWSCGTRSVRCTLTQVHSIATWIFTTQTITPQNLDPSVIRMHACFLLGSHHSAGIRPPPSRTRVTNSWRLLSKAEH